MSNTTGNKFPCLSPGKAAGYGTADDAISPRPPGFSIHEQVIISNALLSTFPVRSIFPHHRRAGIPDIAGLSGHRCRGSADIAITSGGPHSTGSDYAI